jgi:hypothetical protein
MTMNATYASRDDFLADLNRKRLYSSGGWYGFVGTVEGHEIQLKSFGTWNQRYDHDGLMCGGICDLNVSEWKREILEPF